MSERHGRWSRQLRQGQDPLILEVGRVAPQVKGSVLLTAGRNVLLVTAVSRPEPATDLGFFPLTVEYREKMAGAGRIPGGFLRREARAGNHEILGSRVVDRTVRPFFPDGFMCETQILATVMSFDPEGDAEVMAITGASAALTVSEIPWGGPVAGVRVARVQGEMRLFPTRMEREMADLDLLVSVSRQGLVMVEGSAGEVPEETLLEALAVAGEGATSLLEVQEEMRADRGAEKRIFQASGIDPVVREKATAVLRPRIDELFAAQPKHRRHEIGAELITAVEEVLTPDDAEETGRTGQADLAESALGSSEIGGAKEPQGMRPAVPGL
ncbi:MAG: polyribonucleotide nucleotidyltransferase, partial [Candidatus Eisenbacteria sp.]|nr:polyribonucleotide nucleotidyltransferase [Candidatus Eisenbacteria bacterium]